MPYIPESRRREFGNPETAETVGELNYLLTFTVMQYCDAQRVSYRVINDVLGALEGAKLEFYRRVAAPYEDQKKELNGDVY